VTARLRKCFEVRILPRWTNAKWEDGEEEAGFYFAATAGIAKAQRMAHAREWDDERELWPRVRARRAPDRDVLLPPRHYLADRLTADELHTVVHAYGGTGLKAGRRDHFYTHAGDLQLLRLAWEEGLFEGPFSRPSERNFDGTADYAYFYLTRLGQQVAASVAEHYPSH